MARDLSTAQFSNVSGVATRPLYAVQIELSGDMEYLSTGGTIEFDGITHIGGAAVPAIVGSESATVELNVTTDRVNACISGAWRGNKICKVFAIPGLPADDSMYDLADGVLLVDGYIDTVSASSDRITITAIHKNTLTGFAPRLTLNELSDHIPPVGSLFVLDGGSFVLVTGR